MSTTEPKPAGEPLVMPQDEFEAVRKVAAMLGMDQPTPALGEPLTDAQCERLYRMAVEDDTVVLDRKHVPAIRDALSAAISNTHYDALVKPYRAALEALDGSEEGTGHG